MRLSTVFELLLIFLLIAFAAYGRVIDRDEFTIHRSVKSTNESRQGNMGIQLMSLKQATENVNQYCVCSVNICNCCTQFNISIFQLKGPGCASLQYLEKDKMAVQLSMGENILTSTIVDGKKPKPVCVPMPGGLTKFCGRIYSIVREAENNFKACLGLELQSANNLEASLRVSCFRFGPDGVKLRPAEQLPLVPEEVKPADDDDDDEDFFGLDDDDEDDEDEDAPAGNAVPDSSTSEDDEEEEDDDDLLGFGAIFDIFAGGDDSDKKKKPPIVITEAPTLLFTIPILTMPITEQPSILVNGNSASSINKPIPAKPAIIGTSSVADDNNNNELHSTSTVVLNDDEKLDESVMTESTSKASIAGAETSAVSTDAAAIEESSATNQESNIDNSKISGVTVHHVENDVKLEKPLTILKKVKTQVKKKPNLTSSSPNAIKNDSKKPFISSVIIKKPTRPDPIHTYVATSQNNVNNNEDEQEDDDDDDDILGTSELVEDDDDDDDKFDLENETDENEDENSDDGKDENEEVNDDEDEDKKNEDQQEDEDIDDLIDDDEDERDEDEEEEAVITALVDDNDVKDKNKVADNMANDHDEDDADYGLGLGELLSRKRSMRSGRQSKVMRL